MILYEFEFLIKKIFNKNYIWYNENN